MEHSNYNKHTKLFARNLRNQSTLGEIILWKDVLRARKMYGYQFNRQFSFEFENKQYIVDFVCRKLKLIIEIDGYSHQFKSEQDIVRDDQFKQLGYTIIRFAEFEVRHHLNQVIAAIEQTVLLLEQNPFL
jgi:very-short-patch-repair endonuclease